MAMFVHIADARQQRSLERSGIRPSGSRREPGRGVYAMPVLADYFVSHQWLRELKRGGAKTMLAIHFRVPDGETVLVGHYRAAHAAMEAARAIGLIMAAPDARGYEVLIPRKIEPAEIHALRPISQIVGWRYYPEAHGKRPCGCPVCVPRGSIKSRKLRDAFEATMSREIEGKDAE
jgi:hypothetical protein